MLNSWLELNMIVNSKEQEIICSYFNRYTLGNQIDNNHIKMYFDCNDKNKVDVIIRRLQKSFQINFDWERIKAQNWMENWKKRKREVWN